LTNSEDVPKKKQKKQKPFFFFGGEVEKIQSSNRGKTVGESLKIMVGNGIW